MKLAARPGRIRVLARDESAQGVVEFAILISMLFIIFLGTVDFARFLYFQQGITSAARVGAETASNHCAFASTLCAQSFTPISDDLVEWKTYCEATPYAKLQPAYASCTPGTTSSWTPTCSGTCSPCAQDICVSPSTRSSGTEVTVTVGYSFKPLTLLISPFFPDRSCFTGDSASANHHTICASATGRVS